MFIIVIHDPKHPEHVGIGTNHYRTREEAFERRRVLLERWHRQLDGYRLLADSESFEGALARAQADSMARTGEPLYRVYELREVQPIDISLLPKLELGGDHA